MTHNELIETLGEGTVQLVSRSSVYMKSDYYVMAAPIGKNGFETGQHQGSGEKDFLTKDEMTGKKSITDEKAKIFPYIINPETQHVFHHMDKYDMSDYSDRAKLILLLYTGEVALSTKEFNKTKHKFVLKSDFVENKIIEKEADLDWEARKLVMESSEEKRLELAYLLNYYSPSFNMPNPSNVPSTNIKAKLLTIVKEDPQSIIDTQKGDKEDRKIKYLIMKLVSKNVIRREGLDFIYNNTPLGATIDAVVLYAKDPRNELTLLKWIQGVDNSPITNTPKAKDDVVEKKKAGQYVQEIKSALFDNDIIKAKEVYEEGVKNNVGYPAFKALKGAIEAAEKDLENGNDENPHAQTSGKSKEK